MSVAGVSFWWAAFFLGFADCGRASEAPVSRTQAMIESVQRDEAQERRFAGARMVLLLMTHR